LGQGAISYPFVATMISLARKVAPSALDPG
jgi:hypothetical protein